MRLPNPMDPPSDHSPNPWETGGETVDLSGLKFGKEGTEGSLQTMMKRLEQQKANAENSEYFSQDYTVDEVEKLSEMVNVAKEKEAEEEMKAEADKEQAQKTLDKTNQIEQRQAEVLQSNNALGGLFNAAVHSYNQHVFTKNQLASETKKSGLLQAYLAGDESDFATAIGESNKVITDIGGLIEEVSALADDTKTHSATISDLFDWDDDCTKNLNALVTQVLGLDRRIQDMSLALQVSMDQTTTMNRELADQIANSRAPPISTAEETKHELEVKSASELAKEALVQVGEKDTLLKSHPDYHSWSFGDKFQHLFTQLKVKSGNMAGHAEDVVHTAELSAKQVIESLEQRISSYAKISKAALASVPQELLSPIQHA